MVRKLFRRDEQECSPFGAAAAALILQRNVHHPPSPWRRPLPRRSTTCAHNLCCLRRREVSVNSAMLVTKVAGCSQQPLALIFRRAALCDERIDLQTPTSSSIHRWTTDEIQRLTEWIAKIGASHCPVCSTRIDCRQCQANSCFGVFAVGIPISGRTCKGRIELGEPVIYLLGVTVPPPGLSIYPA